MAVPSSASAFIYTGNNSTVTVYPFPAPFLLASDIFVHVKVTLDEEDEGEILQQGVDYTLALLTDSDNLITGGEITTAIAYDSTYTVTIFRQVPMTQLTEFPETGPFQARAVELALDKASMQLQQIHRRVLALEGEGDGGSVIVVPEGSSGQDALQDVATFADATARGNATPKRVGQLGVQTDNKSLWQSYAVSAGAWTPVVLDEDDMASDSAVHPPSQQSVKAYADAKVEGTKTLQVFRPQHNEPPSTNYATLDTRNGHPVLDFDTTTQESAIFSGRIPEGVSLSAGLTVFLQWAASSATTGTIGWDVAFERMVDGGIDIDADSFGTARTVTAATVSGTSGIAKVTSVAFSQAQLPTDLAPGDAFRVRIRRDVANDDAAGDAELLQTEIRLA